MEGVTAGCLLVKAGSPGARRTGGNTSATRRGGQSSGRPGGEPNRRRTGWSVELGGPPAGGLPAVVGEGLVGLRHAEDVVLALERAALLGLGVHELVGEPLGHRLLAALAGEEDEPADGERAGAAGRDLDGHLVGGASDAARADL